MSENAIRIEDVNIINGSFRIESLSLVIKRGYITAITGGNGAGKTTLIEAAAGINGVTKGAIYIEDYDIYSQPVKAKNNIGFIFHNCPFDEKFSGIQCMKMFGKFYEGFDNERFKEICNEFNIDIYRPIKNMSKGQAVKLQLAFALAHDARVLLFDDATEGLDPVFRAELKKRLSEIVSDGAHTVVMATKIPEDLEDIVDYVVSMKYGKIAEIMNIEEIKDTCSGGVLEYLRDRGGM